MVAIETDKATVDFEMQDEGYVACLLYPEGTKDIELGKVLAIIVDKKEDIAAFANYKPDDDSSATPAATPAPAAPVVAATPAAAPVATPAAAQPSRPSGDRVFASPLAKNAADAAGLNLNLVSGSGPNGRIIKADITDAIQSGAHKQAPA